MSDERDEKLAEMMRNLADALKIVGAKFRAIDATSATLVEMTNVLALQCKANADLPPIPEVGIFAAAAIEHRDSSQKLHTAIIRLVDRMEVISEQILSGEWPPSE